MSLTKKMVEDWLGTSNQLNEAIEVIYEIANDEYKVEALKQDIAEYYEGNWKYIEEGKWA